MKPFTVAERLIEAWICEAAVDSALPHLSFWCFSVSWLNVSNPQGPGGIFTWGLLIHPPKGWDVVSPTPPPYMWKLKEDYLSEECLRLLNQTVTGKYDLSGRKKNPSSSCQRPVWCRRCFMASDSVSLCMHQCSLPSRAVAHCLPTERRTFFGSPLGYILMIKYGGGVRNTNCSFWVGVWRLRAI